jgi:hypothetical protein
MSKFGWIVKKGEKKKKKKKRKERNANFCSFFNDLVSE